MHISEFSGEETPIPTGCKPTFTERPTIRQVEEGKITFECRLVGQPRPDVSWFHNEKKVEGRRHKVRSNDLEYIHSVWIIWDRLVEGT